MSGFQSLFQGNYARSMLSIRRSDIPHYLRASDFYLALDEGDDGPISIPEQCFKVDTVVHDKPSLRNLLQTIRFWGVNEIIDEVYYASQYRPHYATVFAEFSSDLSYLPVLLEFRPLLGMYNRITTAVNAGNLIVVKYLIEKKLTSEDATILEGKSGCDFAARAAQHGHLLCLTYVHSVGCHWNSRTCESAASGGHIECLKYARENGCDWKPERMVDHACKGGNLDCLKYVMENQCNVPYNTIPSTVLQTDNLACVKYLYNHGAVWCPDFVSQCTMNNCLKCLRYALANGCAVHFAIFHRFRSIECVQIIHESGYRWDASCCTMAARCGDILILKYLRKLGCPWDEDTIKYSVMCSAGMDCLQYAHENGCPWGYSAGVAGIEYMNKPALTYLHAQGYIFEKNHTVQAHRSLEMLTLLYELGSPWSEDVVHYAIMSSNKACLVYALENGCPAGPEVCREAGFRGHYEILVYLHTKGFELQRFYVNEDNHACAEYVEHHIPRQKCVMC